MTEQEQKAKAAAKYLREFCKAHGCMYCVFRRSWSDKLGLKHDRCDLGKRPSEWTDELKEEDQGND